MTGALRISPWVDTMSEALCLFTALTRSDCTGWRPTTSGDFTGGKAMSQFVVARPVQHSKSQFVSFPSALATVRDCYKYIIHPQYEAKIG